MKMQIVSILRDNNMYIRSKYCIEIKRLIVEICCVNEFSYLLFIEYIYIYGTLN